MGGRCTLRAREAWVLFAYTVGKEMVFTVSISVWQVRMISEENRKVGRKGESDCNFLTGSNGQIMEVRLGMEAPQGHSISACNEGTRQREERRYKNDS